VKIWFGLFIKEIILFRFFDLKNFFVENENKEFFFKKSESHSLQIKFE
jgi:hypothetical protein